MIQLTLLLALGGGAYLLTSGKQPRLDKKQTSQFEDYQVFSRDNQEAGISWGTQRSKDFQLANLNEVYKPRSAPRQKGTNTVNDVFKDQADVGSWLTQNTYPFFFRRVSEVPLSTAAQSNLNIEIPVKGRSFRGDPLNSLAHYPRVYSDNVRASDRNALLFTGEKGTLAAEEPETTEELRYARDNQPQFLYNPFGPGGVIQRLTNRGSRAKTKRIKADQARIGTPSRLDRGRFTFGFEE